MGFRIGPTLVTICRAFIDVSGHLPLPVLQGSGGEKHKEVIFISEMDGLPKRVLSIFRSAGLVL